MSKLTDTLHEVEGHTYITRRGFIIKGKQLFIGVVHDELFSWDEFKPILKGRNWRDYCVKNKEPIIRFDLSGHCSAFEFFVKPSRSDLKHCASLGRTVVTVAIHYGTIADAEKLERDINKLRGVYG